MLCNFLAVPCVGVFGQMNQFPWERDGSSSDICPTLYVQQVSSKKLFVKIFGKKRCLKQSFPKFSRNESQYQLTNKSRERYLFCSVPPTSIHTVIPIIAVINILVINIYIHYHPILEIDYRGYNANRTKDIWEDQKNGRPKNLIGECQNICS